MNSMPRFIAKSLKEVGTLRIRKYICFSQMNLVYITEL